MDDYRLLNSAGLSSTYNITRKYLPMIILDSILIRYLDKSILQRTTRAR